MTSKNLKKKTIKKQQQCQFTIAGGRMEQEIIQKSKFAQINDKRFYFSDRIVLLLFLHPNLQSIINYKDEKGPKTEK